jgi:ABC-type sulfate/molybdate transport systems ATPase subunit
VALARALACRPEVLLLDEPLAHVDKATAAILELLVVALSAKGMTIVMSSHDERLGGRLGGRVIHLEEGKVDWMSEECASGLAHEAVGDQHAIA